MSFIFNAQKPVSPERQKIAKALLERQQAEGLSFGPMPQNVGEGIASFGSSIADGLQSRWLDNQAKAPTDAWADMRQVGMQQPTMQNMGSPMGGFGGPLLDGFRRLFG